MIIDFLELINTCTQILYEIIMEKKRKGQQLEQLSFYIFNISNDVS